MSVVMGNLSSWNKLSTFPALVYDTRRRNLLNLKSWVRVVHHLHTYVGSSLALSRRYMSSAEFSSLRSIDDEGHCTNSYVCTCMYVHMEYIPHFLRDLFHDVVCDDVSVSDALPVAVVIVLP